LLVLVILASIALRHRWLEIKAREEALLKRFVPSPGAPTVPALPTHAAATAAQYLEVAEKMVFARDRNPNVILDPPEPPPPPKPVPDLPVAYGVMNLGDGPTAILSVKSGAEHRGYKPGEKIGEFKVVALNNKEIVFEWEGKYLKKSFEELADRRPAVASAPEQPAQPAAAPPPQQQATTIGKAEGPGADMGNSTRACVPGDTSPPGTVKDGLKKVVTKTPFGDSCRWEPAK
jgi:hypothetical protein